MWHDVIVYFLSVDICLLHSVANCLPHVLPITYFMCCRHSLLHCVAVIAYFIVLPSLLTSLCCRHCLLHCVAVIAYFIVAVIAYFIIAMPSALPKVLPPLSFSI